MSKHLSVFVAALCGCILLTCSAGGAWADRRIALVIGNSNYTNPSLVLSNPKNDAEDVAAALRSLGFEVVQATDTNKRDMDLSMAKFARLATDSDAALFYYAGHALQYQGRNYLMPIDAEVEDEVSLRYQMMPIDDVRAALDRASGVKVMILDACRNNPVVDSMRRKASGESRALGGVRGLARIDKTQGTVIAYSTAADEVAADGQGRNSPFTTALLKRLKEPGLEIEQLFRRVAADVNSATNGRQRPETYVSLLSDYYLNQTDRTAFDGIKDSADPVALRDFIIRFPSSSYASDAQYRIQRIENEAREKQLQQARQQQAARLLEQGKTDQDASGSPARPGPTKLAGVERQDLNATPQATAPAAQAPKALAEPAPQPPAAASNKSCDQDNAKLARLRGGASVDEVIQFESTLTCERLRPQVARLRESLGGTPPALSAPEPAGPAVASGPPPAPPAVQTATLQSLDKPPAKPEPPAPPERPADLKSQPKAAPANPIAACKQDEARLARLRANPSLADIVTFERELGCEKLRPQLARMRESLGPAADSNTREGNPAKAQPAPRKIDTERSRASIVPIVPTPMPDPTQELAALPPPALPSQDIPSQDIPSQGVPSQDLAPAKPTLSAAEIAKSVKSELSRVGCFTGSVDGEWNAASRRSLGLFNKNAGTNLDVELASLGALDAIKLKPSRVCPLVCGHGFKADGDRCGRIACADGMFLNDDNECERRRARTPTAKRNDDDRPDRPVRERPKPEANAAKPQVTGQIICNSTGCHPLKKGCHAGPPQRDGSSEEICN